MARSKTVPQVIGLSGWLVLLLLLLLPSGGLVLSGNLFQERVEIVVPDRKIGYFTYIFENASAALLVDVELARMRKAEKYIPLAVTLANKDIRVLRIQRQSFQLLDPAGTTYTMPDFKALEAVYKKYSADAKYYARKLFSEDELQTSFSSFRQLPCSFFPHPYKDSILHDVLIEDVELPQGTLVKDLIYFPKPKSGEPGQVLRLRLLDEKFETYIDVGFVID